MPLPHGDRAKELEKRKSSEPPEEIHSSQAASICCYLFQVIFQVHFFVLSSSFSDTEKGYNKQASCHVSLVGY